MYMPPDSWYKYGYDNRSDTQPDIDVDFGIDASHILEYLKDGPSYQPFNGDLQQMAQQVFSVTQRRFKTSQDVMKYLLEGLRMPVQNEKTGEQDFVDISLVDKIVIDSEYIEDMITNKKLKVDINLSGNKESQEVYVTADCKEIAVALTEMISLQSFEEMLYKAIHEVKDQRLEDVEDFHHITKRLLTQMVDNQEKTRDYYFAEVEKDYHRLKGLGIIRDTKANQIVGTFENLSYRYNKNARLATINGIILSGRTFEDLEEEDRYELAFYSIDHGLIYSIIAGNKSNIEHIDEVTGMMEYSKFNLVMDDTFDENHQYYTLISNAQDKKTLIENMNVNHPVYAANYAQFKQSRLDILEESKSRQKQEKLVNQFADIDLF